MMKTTYKFAVILIVLWAGQSFAQLSSYTGKTHRQLAGSPTATSRADSILFTGFVVMDSIISVIANTGDIASNFGTLSAAIDAASADTGIVIVPPRFFNISNDTLPRTASMTVRCGATISVNSGATFLIRGYFTAPRCKVFAGGGTVTFDEGSIDFIYPEWFGSRSDSTTASLTGFNSSMSSVPIGRNFNLADGMYSTTDSINIAKPISIRGNVPPRRWTMTGGTRTSAIIGSDIRSSNNANGGGIRISSRGVNLSDLTVRGDATKNNGIGVRLALTINTTTMGDNTLYNVHSGYNKIDGFRWECPDNSSIMWDCDANINRGYGIKVIPISGASGGLGINFLMIGGRTRKNGLGGLNLDAQFNSTIMNAGFIADTTYGVLISGSGGQDSRTILMNVDAEQQVHKTGAFPATSLRIMTDSRQGLFMNNFLGVSSSVAGTTVRRRVSLGGTVRSSVWINNTFSGINTTNSDSGVVVEPGATVHALWLGDNGYSGAFDPIDSVDVLSTGVYRAAWIGIDHNNTGGEFFIKTNKETEFTVKGTSADTLFIQNISGPVNVDGDAGLNLNPTADAGATLFKDSGTGENRTFRVYGDSAGTPRYVQLQIEATTGRAGFLHQTNQFIIMRSPVNIATTSYVGFVERGGVPATPAASNGLLTYKTDNRLWMRDDLGDSVQVAPYTGSATWNPANLTTGSTDSTSVTATGAAVGDVVTVGHSGITTAHANMELFGHVVSANTVRVFLRNNDAGTYDTPSGTVKVRVWK